MLMARFNHVAPCANEKWMEFFRNIFRNLFRLIFLFAGEESDKGGIMAASGEDADLGAAAALL